MDNKNALKSLNMTGGEVLTLEKAKDRIEFEALPLMSGIELAEDARCRTYNWECPGFEEI